MLTVPEAAQRAGRDPETIRRWIRAGKLTSWRIGTQHVIDEDDLTNLLRGYGNRPRSPDPARADMTSDEIVATLHRSRAERSAQISEALAPYMPGARDAPIAVGDPWLPAIVGRIVRAVDPVRIMLFGSRARGAARPDSDYDILVVVDELPDRRATRLRLRRVLADLPVSKDIVVATAGEAAGAPDLLGDVLQAAVAEGRAVYERA